MILFFKGHKNTQKHPKDHPGRLNMEPENTPLEGENHLNQTITIIIFGFYVNLRGVPIKQHRQEALQRCETLIGRLPPMEGPAGTPSFSVGLRSKDM